MDKIINDYQILSTVRNQSGYHLLEAINKKNDSKCLLKVWKSEHPSIEDLAKIKNEYLLLKNLNSKYISRGIDIQKYNNSLVIEIEYFNGITLKNFELSHTIDLTLFLKIAIQLADTLIDLFEQQVVLMEFSPEIIFINPESNETKLIDLGNPIDSFEGYIEKIRTNIFLLNYISPELTGRMQCPIDYRSNIYTLGLVLYEMITGKLPFYDTDPIAVIHNHIAQIPVPPIEIDVSIPKAISEIILLCLKKAPEDRYQNLSGLRFDLENCFFEYQRNGSIDPAFKPGQRDVRKIIHTSSKLYGKSKQLFHFKEKYERISKGSCEWLLISGEHGLGSSFLVDQLSLIPPFPSLVARGKYAASQQHIPLSGLITAFSHLVNQQLKESQEKIDALRMELSANLQENGQLIIDIIPELQFIIGKQPPLIKLTFEESQHRLRRVFTDFMRVFASAEHPLTLILEDLQLADQASLDCIKYLLTDKRVAYLLIVGTFCSEEIDLNDALTRTINDLRQENQSIETIELKPFDQNTTIDFVADSLNMDKKNVIKLADLLHNKTNGNPFYIVELLKKLFDQNYIVFNSEKNEWTWELETLKKLEFSKNVIDFMIHSMQMYSLETQKMLSLAAAIGTKFDMQLLFKASDLPPHQILKSLLPAIKSESIKSNIDTKKLETIFEQGAKNFDLFLANNPLTFEFTNERIREASDALVSGEVKLHQHYQIGRVQLEEFNNRKVLIDDELYFSLLTHLNLARSIITNPEERLDLAKMNLEGGYKAKKSTAYALALNLFSIARELLPANSWKKNYDLTFPIYLQSAECSLLQKNFNDMEMLSKEILQHARANLDKGKLYIIQMEYYINLTHYSKAVDTGIICAKLFGNNIPLQPSKIQIIIQLLKVNWLLRQQGMANMEKLPMATDEEIIFMQKIFYNIGVPAFLTSRHLAAYTAFKNLECILRFGYSEVTSVIFATYAVILVSLFGAYESALKWSRFAIFYAQYFESHALRCRVYFFMLILVGHWTLPFSELKEILQKCYQHGLNAGDLFYLSYITVFFGFGDGTYLSDLKEAKARLEKYTGILHTAKNQQAIESYKIRINFLRVLMTPSFRGSSMSNAEFDEDECYNLIRNNSQNKQVHQGYVAFKMIILYLFGLNDQALKLYEESQNTRDAVLGYMTEKDQLFYITLHQIALYHIYDWRQRLRFRKNVKKTLAKMKKWAKLCPSSNSHRPVIIEAELARVYGKIETAQTLYDEAIKLAKENNFIGEQAMANELAGKFHIKLGKNPTAKIYLSEAHYHYYLWGALSKCSQLEENYPKFLESNLVEIENKKTHPDQQAISSDSFDLAAVIRASSVLSKEIYLDKLVSEVLQLLIVEAGADRAILMMEQNGTWVIQGERQSYHMEETNVLQALPVDEREDLLPVPLVNYVIRTNKMMLINDTSSEGMFNRDPYFIDNKIKSVLCLPIISQGKMAAVLYLENRLSKDVFSPEKINILEMLSTQIASSIENSILYRQLEEYNKNLENKVQERTVELQHKNEELASTLEELKNTQHHLIESGKLAALGQLIAGIAHEINTPLGAVRASSQNAHEAIKTLLELLPIIVKDISEEKIDILLDLIIKATSAKPAQMSSKEERALKRKMIQTFEEYNISYPDELVDFLHDMNIYEDLTEQYKVLGEDALTITNFAYNISSLLKNNKNIIMAVERASKIIFALKTYIHQESSESMQPADLIDGLESVLTLYHHQLKQNIQLEKCFEKIPQIPCRIHELNQIWTNLIQNALHSMNNKGSLEINVFQKEDNIVLQFIDSGGGVPEEIKNKIFSPFFTTKPRGEGSGLGLSISKKIIEAHKGTIFFDSKPGRTMFTVTLPITQMEEVGHG